MEVKIPFHPKKSTCIGCGVIVGSKARGRVKKAISVGSKKALEFWTTQQLVVHHNDHKLCNTCYDNDKIVVEWKMSSYSVDISTLCELLLKCASKQEKQEPEIDSESEQHSILDVMDLTDTECVECCGLTSQSLEQLAQESGCSKQIVFEFFCKCRQRISHRFCGVLFGKKKTTVSENFHRVLENLTMSFVPKYLGSTAFSRESIMNVHTPELFKKCFPKVRGAVDGTYFYAEKSGDFTYQRKTFNVHKGTNLFKEMGIVLPDGMFFDFIGPFFSDGDHNDEWMWSYIVENNCGDISNIFDVKNDEFLADRGFIRVKDKEGMFALQTPANLAPKQKQLNVSEANHSRLVTRFRNVVERAFGRLKKHWKIIDDVISSGLWPKLHSLIRLLAAVENAFSPPLWTDKDTDENDLLMIKDKLDMKENDLQAVHESTEKNIWNKITCEEIVKQVPELTMKDLRKWSVGPYALTLAKPYLDHAKDLKFWKHKKQKHVYKVKGMLSRFVTSDNAQPKKYTILVKIPPNGKVSDILSYCTCKAGARTLGGCAHSCAILYHFTVKLDDSSMYKANTSKKRVSTSGTIDLKSFKTQKKSESKMESQESSQITVNNNTDAE